MQTKGKQLYDFEPPGLNIFLDLEKKKLEEDLEEMQMRIELLEIERDRLAKENRELRKQNERDQEAFQALKSNYTRLLQKLQRLEYDSYIEI